MLKKRYVKSSKRLLALDVARGVAIVSMLIFHFTFDLNYFHIFEINIRTEWFWRIYRWMGLSLFVWVAGYALVLLHKESVKWKKALKRSLKLALLALVITAVSLYLFPKSFIYFGALHFFSVATLLGLFFVHRPYVALITALLILLGSYLGYVNMHGLYHVSKDLLHLPRISQDLVPLIPWMAPLLLGIFSAHINLLPDIKETQFVKSMLFLGRHSLVIYMVHQPIFFALLSLFVWLF